MAGRLSTIAPHHRVTITNENVDAFTQLLDELQRFREPLVQLTLRYPVEIELMSLRFVFVNEAELTGFIDHLDDSLEAFSQRRGAAGQQYASA